MFKNANYFHQYSPVSALKAAGIENVDEMLAQHNYTFVLTRLPEDRLGKYFVILHIINIILHYFVCEFTFCMRFSSTYDMH